MTKVDDLKTSRFLTKNDVEPPRWLTISKVEVMNVAMDKQPRKMKHCLHFEEIEKPLVLNVTNGRRIKTYYVKDDRDIEKWVGFKIRFWNDSEVEYGGELTGGIRVIIPQQPTQEIPSDTQNSTQKSNYVDAPDPDPSITNKPVPEKGFCSKCGKPRSENCNCDDVPF